MMQKTEGHLTAYWKERGKLTSKTLPDKELQDILSLPEAGKISDDINLINAIKSKFGCSHSSHIEFFHAGQNVGFQSYFVGFPETGQGAVIMTNSDNGSNLVPEILASIASTYDWPKSFNHSAQRECIVELSNPAETYSKYAGLFNLPQGPDQNLKIKLTNENNKFYIHMPHPGPQDPPKAFELFPTSDNRFVSDEAGVSFSFPGGNKDELEIGGQKATRIPLSTTAHLAVAAVRLQQDIEEPKLEVPAKKPPSSAASRAEATPALKPTEPEPTSPRRGHR
jgi:hypothetical protein